MNKILLSLVIFAALAISANADIYAVLIAGSNGWYNYRHQADTCHGYQTLLDKGVSADNIIVLSYNDVASSSENPFPNQLYNAPSTGAGWDVNKNCVIDYQGNDVSPTNYLNILKGNSSALKGIGTGRVLLSGENDFVFLAFYDHGGSGILGFPNGELLYADDFQNALKYMHQNKMFRQLTYYMEACESGSMWTNFPTDLNIYALSAANATESSWATYCPPGEVTQNGTDVVNGTAMGVCLGDLFSVNWMQNVDQANTLMESLQAQFKLVKNETTLSHVCQWGNLGFTSEFISDFFGSKNSKFRPKKPTPRQQAEKYQSVQNSRDIKLNYYRRQWQLDPTNATKLKAYQDAQQSHAYFIQVFLRIRQKAGLTNDEAPLQVLNFDCYKQLINQFQSKCMPFDDFGLQFAGVLSQVCDQTNVEGMDSKIAMITDSCAEQDQVYGIIRQ